MCWQRQAGVRWLLLHNTQLFSHLALIAARHLGKWLLDCLDLKLLILMLAFPTFNQWCENVLQRWSCSKRFALRRECISHKNSWVLKTRSIAPSLEIGVIANILQIFMITDYGKMWQCTLSLCQSSLGTNFGKKDWRNDFGFWNKNILFCLIILKFHTERVYV